MTPVQLQVRRDTAADWSSANPVLSQGELGFDTTNSLIKIGDGVTPWNSITGSLSTRTAPPTPAAAYVSTSETSTSTTYADLTTTTDQVTVTIGPSGMVQVFIAVYHQSSAVGVYTFTSFAMSGANTLAAGDDRTILATQVASGNWAGGAPYLLTGLNPGSTTFKMKYRVSSGTGTWSSRRIAAIPL